MYVELTVEFVDASMSLRLLKRSEGLLTFVFGSSSSATTDTYVVLVAGTVPKTPSFKMKTTRLTFVERIFLSHREGNGQKRSFWEFLFRFHVNSDTVATSSHPSRVSRRSTARETFPLVS